MSDSTIRNKIRSKITKVKNFVVEDFNKQPTDEELSKLNSYSIYFKAYFFQYSIAAIIVGLAIKPLTIFSDPIALAITGFILAYAVFTAYRLLVVSSVNRLIKRGWLAIEMIIVTILLIGSLFYTGNETLNASADHDLYCQGIQHLVESGKDSEKNSTIFNNMQCRFQPFNR